MHTDLHPSNVPYTLTGASDWEIAITLIGGAFALFGVINILLLLVVKYWVAGITLSVNKATDGITDLVKAVAERKAAEQALKNEMLLYMNKLSSDFSGTIVTALEKMEERAVAQLNLHILQQDKDINRMFEELRVLKKKLPFWKRNI
jgi:hypothetical protein